MNQIKNKKEKTMVSLTKEPLSYNQIISLILDINIEAIQKALKDNDSQDLGILGISKEHIEKEAKNISEYFTHIKGIINSRFSYEGFIKSSINEIDRLWFNTLKSTLYTIEYDLISMNIDNYPVIMNIWRMFLDIDKNQLIRTPINIKEVWKGIKQNAMVG